MDGRGQNAYGILVVKPYGKIINAIHRCGREYNIRNYLKWKRI
jgi:hypothetical protein